MKTIVVLLDTVRKDMLKIYNPNTDVQTPNITDFANDSYIFDNHCTGSLPCMPARRDLFTGRFDFFDRFWGPAEPFDVLLPNEFNKNKIPTHIITDHAHYWRHGGEGYIQSFETFNMNRGQETDQYISYIDSANIPTNVHGKPNDQFYKNSSVVKSEQDYPTTQTFEQASDFVEQHKDDERFYLQVEGFDPHEPFTAPDEFYEMYDLNDIGQYYNAPAYGPDVDTPEQNEHILKRYKANLSFADYNFGKLINKLKELEIYEQCNIIFTSDHGFHIGDHGFIGKGVTHVYNEVSDIPLFHKLPNQQETKRFSEFTQLVDIMPTLVEMYNVEGNYNFHGISYLPLLKGEQYTKRDDIISAYFGSSITYKDYENTYLKPKKKGAIEKIYTAMPKSIMGYLSNQNPMFPFNHDDIDAGRFLNHTDYPVFEFTLKIPMSRARELQHELYSKSDLKQETNIITADLQKQYNQKVLAKLKQLKANEHYITTFDFD